MRKFSLIFTVFIIIAICSITFCPSFISATATSNEYYKVTSNDVVFYNEDNNELFIVPNSYYLLKTGEQLTGDYYYVSYQGIDGKVLKTSVGTSVFDIEDPYYLNVVNLDKTFLLICSIPSLTAEDPIYISDITRNFNFIGVTSDVSTTDKWYYVSYTSGANLRYGYIISSDTTKPELATTIPAFVEEPINTDSPSPSTTLNPDTPEEPTNNLLRVLLILGISIPAVIVVFLLFRPSKGKGSNYHNRPRERERDRDEYYDEYEDDYYDDYRDNRRDPRDYRRRR